MAINDILNKINDEANKKAAFEKQVANDEIKKINVEAEEKAKERTAEVDRKADAKCESLARQAKILAKMENRSSLLKEKRMVIDEVYKSSLDNLYALDDSAYVDLVTSMLKSVSTSMSEGDLTVPADKKQQTESAIKKAGVSYDISKEANDFKGGFILKSKKVEMNFSFSYLMSKVIRPHSELEVAETLF